MAHTESRLAASFATILQRTQRQSLGPDSVERRYRLMVFLALYGGALGAAAIIISFLARQQLRAPLYETQHLSLNIYVFLSGAGLIAGALVVSMLTYWLISRSNFAQHPLAWVAIGFGYAILVPFATGFLAPFSIVFLNLQLGVFESGDVSPGLLDALFRAPHSTFSYGTVALGTTAVAALMFAPGAWLIDTVNASRSVIVARYGSFAITLALSSGFVAFAVLGPPSTLAKLG